jgi:cell division protein FtsQ
MTAERFFERSRAERRRRWIRIALGVLLVAALGALVWLVWFSSVLAVRDVEVAGRTTLKQAQVLQAAQVPQGRPLARVDVEGIEGRVSALDRVDTVEVSRSWPHTISISIVERKSVVWARLDGRIRGIDRNGIAFRTYGSPPKGLLEATIDVTDGRDRLQTSESLASVVALIRFARTGRVGDGGQQGLDRAQAHQGAHGRVGEQGRRSPQAAGADRAAGARGVALRRQRSRPAHHDAVAAACRPSRAGPSAYGSCRSQVDITITLHLRVTVHAPRPPTNFMSLTPELIHPAQHPRKDTRWRSRTTSP